MRVWLDDTRDAPPGWVRTFTPQEVIGLLQLGKVTEFSLDHFLGLEGGETERTGYTVLAWLESEVGSGRWTRPLPVMSVHSGDPVARRRMERVVRIIRRLHVMGYGPRDA